MTEIRPWLWVGKYAETLDRELLRGCGITAVLQLAEEVRHADLDSLYLPVEDGMPLDHELLRRGVEYVRRHKRQGGRVLVACGAGISRSPSFCIAAILEEEGQGLMDALRAVSGRHSVALPHAQLWRSLCTYYGEEIPSGRMFDEIRPISPAPES